MADLRNPYVILGVPFGANGHEARVGFAQASRRLKAGGDHLYTLEDLTWALNQVERIIEEPDVAFSIYRIPANPEAVEHTASGIFNPPPTPMPRSTPPATEAQYDQLRSRAVADLLRTALAGDPVDADLQIPYE